MKRHDYGLFTFTGGIGLLIIQFLMIVFNVVNGVSPFNDNVFVYVEQVTFLDVVSSVWASLVGTVLLIALYIRRFIKGHEAVLVLVGALLWIIQLFNFYESTVDIKAFTIHYILGIIGIFFILITGFYEAYYIKRMENTDTDTE